MCYIDVYILYMCTYLAGRRLGRRWDILGQTCAMA